MDGILNLYKPRGISSAKALYRIRKVCGQRKSGHAGTLDPAAEGVLLLCMGRATKLVERLMDQPKVYRTTARLDLTSTSFDLDHPTRDVAVGNPPDIAAVREALAQQQGTISQMPPAVSALKIAGRPAYRLVRSGQTPILKPRMVDIYWMHLHSYQWPELDFEMACGRGTYVRAVIRDIGEALGVGGCLTRLLRKQVGPFGADAAKILDDLVDSDRVREAVLPLAEAIELLSRPVVTPARPEAVAIRGADEPTVPPCIS